MDLRLALLELSAKHGLSADANAKLNALAGLGAEPPRLQKRLPIGMAILGAILGGLGIIFWVAANWESLGRFGRFALLEAIVAVMCIGAWHRPSARVPLSLIAFLACGGLFAYFGQTYQTGADPWQLFALWAALTLPLALGVRHDALWAAWAMVTLTGFALCAHAHTGQWWERDPSYGMISLASWVPALGLSLAFSPLLRERIGAGVWSMRLCSVYGTTSLVILALISLFTRPSPLFYLAAFVALGAIGYALSQRRMFDIFALSAVGLGLNAMFVSGVARMFSVSGMREPIFMMLVIGGGAAGLLAWSVTYIMKVARTHAGVAQ
jgi:uncharacterized membrane protein